MKFSRAPNEQRWNRTGMEIAAHAKINLSLDVLGKRPDGYHNLRMIMQTVELHDTVLLNETKNGISLKCSSRWVPQDETNIAWKAAKLLMDKKDIHRGVAIEITKRIPVSAGLAGGSTDAAAVLRGMNGLFSLDLDEDELKDLGKQIGADVPYCIRGGTRLAEGIGEKLTALEDFTGVDIVLVKPNMGISTAWVYQNLDISKIGDSDRPKTELLIQMLIKRDINGVSQNMRNVLEKVTVPKFAIIQEIKNKLIGLGALGSMMSGSGPTVFGIFSDSSTASIAYGSLAKDRRWQCFCVKTSGA